MKPLVIVGPTSSGKTSLSFWIATQAPPELVSQGVDILVLDSKQVYKHQNVVTGKDLPSASELKKMHVRIFGVDIVNPDEEWSVAQSISYAEFVIRQAREENRFLIIVGGTPQYLLSVFEKKTSFFVQPNVVLRAKLESQSVEVLQAQLRELDRRKLESFNHSDRHNPRRLIRAIEVATSTVEQEEDDEPLLLISECCWIGLATDKKTLESKIRDRVLYRLQSGAKAEYKKISQTFPHWTKEARAAIGYAEISQFVSGEITEDQLIAVWTLHEIQYAKRQMTWWKREQQITWFEAASETLKEQVLSQLKNCYNVTT